MIASELKYGPHFANVATGELAMREVYCVVVLIAKAVSEGSKKNVYSQEKGNFRYLKK